MVLVGGSLCSVGCSSRVVGMVSRGMVRNI